MAFTPSRLLIFGGTGNIGQYITKAILRAKPPFESVTLFTSQKTVDTKVDLLKEWKAAGLQVRVGDVGSSKDVAEAYKDTKADTVISAVGRGAIDVQVELISLADQSGTVKWFFPSEYGTDIEHNAKSPNEKPHQKKLVVRKHIRENIKNIKITYLVTGPYFDMWVNMLREAEEIGGFNVNKKEAVLIGDGEGKIGFCTMEDVGKALVAALRHPESSFGKALKVQSFIVTPKQVLAEYEKQTGARWDVKFTPLDKLHIYESELWDKGTTAATGATLRRIWAEGGTLYEKNDNELIEFDKETESLETAVSRALNGGKN